MHYNYSLGTIHNNLYLSKSNQKNFLQRAECTIMIINTENCINEVTIATNSTVSYFRKV